MAIGLPISAGDIGNLQRPSATDINERVHLIPELVVPDPMLNMQSTQGLDYTRVSKQSQAIPTGLKFGSLALSNKLVHRTRNRRMPCRKSAVK